MIDSPNTGNKSHRPCLLIVDDDRNLRRLLTATFDCCNYEMHETDNGTEAMSLVARLRPAVVLLDVMLSGDMDGVEVCRRIKGNPDLSSTSVILLTALGQDRDRERGMAAGADAYVVKPFSPNHLLELVASMVARQWTRTTHESR